MGVGDGENRCMEVFQIFNSFFYRGSSNDLNSKLIAMVIDRHQKTDHLLIYDIHAACEQLNRD